ncbi:MAG: hypothetical protein R2684_10125 [Pyrinomonadaceae bacterium]
MKKNLTGILLFIFVVTGSVVVVGAFRWATGATPALTISSESGEYRGFGRHHRRHPRKKHPKPKSAVFDVARNELFVSFESTGYRRYKRFDLLLLSKEANGNRLVGRYELESDAESIVISEPGLVKQNAGANNLYVSIVPRWMQSPVIAPNMESEFLYPVTIARN